MATTETEVVQGIGSDYEVKYGFSRPDEDYFFKSGRGLSHELVDAISSPQGRAGLDAQVPPQEPRLLPRPAAADLGRRPLAGSTSTTSTTTSGRPRSRPTRGRTCPPTSRTPGTSSGIPEAEKKYLAGVGAQYESEVVYHKLQDELEKQGVHLPRHGLGPPRARGHRPGVLRDDHPAERQQVRGAELGRLVGRLVHLRAAGRARSSCRSRPTSASTRRTWASSSAR